MAKSRTKNKQRRTTPARGRRPTQPRTRRRSPLAGAAIVIVIAIVLVFALTRGGDNGSSPASGAFVGGDLHSLVAMPDGRVYVGGHDGVAVTRDDGRTWRQVDTLAHADAMGWGQHDGTLFVSGHPGLNRSSDDGATFQRANAGLPDTDMHSFGAGRSTLYGAGPRLGVVASTDVGRSWQQRAADAGNAFFGRILVDPDDDNHLIAADAQAGPVESRDGGRSWQPLDAPPAAWLSSPDGGRTLLASGGGNATRSTDGGRTWQALRLPDGALLVEAAPGDGQHLYAAGLTGTDARLWTSSDGGATWTET
jgi:photosystem II stability/assembly factor-like uncharacterized protein